MNELMPSDWLKAKIGDSVKSAFGGVSVNSENKTAGPNEFGILKTSCISDGHFYPHEHKVILREELGRVSIKPKKNHILISRMNTPMLVGQCGYVRRDYENLFLPDRLWQLEIQENFCAKWLSYVLRSDQVVKFIADAATGTSDSMKNIAKPNLMAIPILVPPLVEQEKIASILTAVDDVIVFTQAQINKLKDLKTGMMQELLTKGIGHTEFKDSPVGRIPKAWEVMTVEDVAFEIVVGIVVQPTQYYVHSGVPALRSANVREIGLNGDNLKYITRESNEKLKKSQLYEGNLVTVRTGYPGTTAVVEKQFDGANCIDIIITRPRDSIDSKFLCTWVNSDIGKGQVLKAQGGLAQQHFNVGDMKRMLVAIPPLGEQRKISEVLKSVTLKLEIVNMKLDRLLNHKKALMQDLLTGKVRVNVA